MRIPDETPFKVLKYLSRINSALKLPLKHEKDKVIIYLIDCNYLKIEGRNFTTSTDFRTKYAEFIFPVYHNIILLISKYNIQYTEDYYTTSDFACLLKIENNKKNLIESTFQQILTEYFKSSKHTKKDSNLASAIKAVLGIENFIEDDKDQQYLSILYPKKTSQFIILCENKDRLRNPRHEFIEFWYVGGNNINQLQFIPKTTTPIFYLCDLDFDGLNIYNNIKKKYLKSLKIIIPKNFEHLMIKQTDVKNHKSIWKNDAILLSLKNNEKPIVKVLIEEKKIIEEQRIILSKENLEFNEIV